MFKKLRPLSRQECISLLIIALSLVTPSLASLAANLPPGFVLTRLPDRPATSTAMVVAPDGRLFVCEKTGALRIFKHDVLLPTPFVTVDTDTSGEHGLDGVALDPHFAVNGYVYVYYVAKTPTIHCRVSRFTANGDVAVPGSEVVLLELDTLFTDNHVGGGLRFGPSDGRLYVPVGDDSFLQTQQALSNPQALSNLKGKILRLNQDGSIPIDNPFYLSASGKNRAIWALGLRNPFTLDFQRLTGRMFIDDTGEDTWEEINDGKKGANYGWPICEGPCQPPMPGFTDPLYAYNHGNTATQEDTLGCAITGGAFYEPVSPQFPSNYFGKYFFIDWCKAWIHILDPATGAVSGFATEICNTPSNTAVITVSPDGALYFMRVFDDNADFGAIFKITWAPPTGTQPQASISASPNPISVTDGTGIGITTVSWTSSGVSAVEVHVNSPSGPLFARSGAGSFSSVTAKWVVNGTTFYLQNVSSGLPLTAANTLGSVVVNVN
jgi:glucose/arabinose dehydrogenase